MRGEFEANGKSYRIESDGTTWVNVIDEDGACEGFRFDEDGACIAESGEFLTGEWTDADWRRFNEAVGAKTIGG